MSTPRSKKPFLTAPRTRRSISSADEEVYIIGGASVYQQALPLADRLCLTEIDDTPAEADTFFPPYEDDWKESIREYHAIDEKHAFRYAFVDYIRA